MTPALPVLDYEQFRPEIKTGDILACSGSAPISKIIQRVTLSPWSHVGLIVRVEPFHRIVVMESVESVGVRVVPLSFYLTNYNTSGKAYPGVVAIARHDKFEQGDYCAMGQFAIDHLAYPYDRGEIIKILARVMSRALAFTAGEMADLVRDREYICSEYLLECFEAHGLTLDCDYRGFVAPSNILADPHVTLLGRFVGPQ